MENGEWKMENGEWKAENGEWKTENGERKTENGKRRCDFCLNVQPLCFKNLQFSAFSIVRFAGTEV